MPCSVRVVVDTRGLWRDGEEAMSSSLLEHGEKLQTRLAISEEPWGVYAETQKTNKIQKDLGTL